MWRKGSPPILLVGNKLVEPLWRRVWRFLKTQNTELPYDPAILCLHIYSVTSEVAQSCPTLCDPMDCSLPSSSVHGIFQAIVLEWVAISFSNIYPEGTIIQKDTCTPMFIAARQASLSITNSKSLPKLMSIESVMPSNHLILCRPLLLLPPIPPSMSLFQWVNSSHEVAKVLEFQLQHQSFQWIFRTDFL